MNTAIYESRKSDGSLLARATLSNEIAESRYGFLVLVIEDEHGIESAFGWADTLPSGLTGAGFIRMVVGVRPENFIPESEEWTAALQRAISNIEAMGL